MLNSNLMFDHQLLHVLACDEIQNQKPERLKSSRAEVRTQKLEIQLPDDESKPQEHKGAAQLERRSPDRSTGLEEATPRGTRIQSFFLPSGGSHAQAQLCMD